MTFPLDCNLCPLYPTTPVLIRTGSYSGWRGVVVGGRGTRVKVRVLGTDPITVIDLAGRSVRSSHRI